MSKRGADKYLTDQNWDQEDNDEEATSGSFQKADDDVLKTRVIRKAKRRAVVGQSSGAAFSRFAGLKAPTQNNSVFKGFNLPPKTTSGTEVTGQFKGFSTFQIAKAPVISASAELQKSVSSRTDIRKEAAASATNTALDTKSCDEDESSQGLGEYNRHLSALNKSVSEWIKHHVEKNPLCDLTPVFSDYKKYLSEIDEKFGQSDHEGSQNSFQVSDSQDTVSPKSSKDSSRSSSVSEKSKFTLTGFGASTEKDSGTQVQSTDAPPSKAHFSGFSASTTTLSPFKGFNVQSKATAAPSFSFSSSMVAAGNGVTVAKEESNVQGNEEEYVPPKPESNVVVEEDAFFSIRCKLYFKKGETFADRGVGQLYLKPSGDRTQLLVRADTAVSQILLNILLQPSIPLIRQGKNNVMMTCIPNPPINEKEADKVVPMLIRVKTSEDADRLLEIMEQKKQESPNKGDADR